MTPLRQKKIGKDTGTVCPHARAVNRGREVGTQKRNHTRLDPHSLSEPFLQCLVLIQRNVRKPNAHPHVRMAVGNNAERGENRLVVNDVHYDFGTCRK